MHMRSFCSIRSAPSCATWTPPPAGCCRLPAPLLTAPCLPTLRPLQYTLIFYMYHIDANMMGRAAGKQYPQMLGKHFEGHLGLPAATIVLLAAVSVAGRVWVLAGDIVWWAVAVPPSDCCH